MCDAALNKDKHVRAYAVMALEKIQDFENRAQKTLCFSMVADPNSLVRICALKAIDVNNNTLKYILRSTRSPNSIVRKTGMLFDQMTFG